MKSYDVLIVGAGTAGCASAISLGTQTDLSILLCERNKAVSYKSGEILSPGSNAFINYLGLQDSFLAQGHIESKGIYSVWGSQNIGLRDYFFTSNGTGWHLNRMKFDQLLVNKADESGAKVLFDTKISSARFVPGDKVWLIEARQDGESKSFNCKYIIDASGRNSNFYSIWEGEKYFFDRLIGATTIVEGKLSSYFSYLKNHTFIESVKFGWWYISPLPGNKYSITLMCDGSWASQERIAKIENWMKLLFQSLHSSLVFEDLTVVEGVHIVPAHSACLSAATKNQVVAVGDALTSFDPLSSMGLSFALYSGIEGARVVDSWCQETQDLSKSYDQMSKVHFQNYLSSRKKYYLMEQRWPTCDFWYFRQASLSLNPHSDLTTTNHSANFGTITSFQSPVFSSGLLAKISGFCADSKKSYEVIEFIKKNIEKRMTDQTIILGVQHLVESQVLIAA